MKMSSDNLATYISTLKSVIHLIDTTDRPTAVNIRKLLEAEIERVKKEILGEESYGRQN